MTIMHPQVEPKPVRLLTISLFSVLILIAAMFLSSCRSAEQVAADDTMDCIYNVSLNPKLTAEEKNDLINGCRAIWMMRTGRFGKTVSFYQR